MRTRPPADSGPHSRRFARPTALVLALLLTALTCALALGPLASPGQAATLAAGGERTCAIRDGAVWCWGTASSGLGDGATTTSAVPVRVQGLTNVVEVAVGSGHACARRADRTVWCWGANHDGQLGDGTTTHATTPKSVIGITDAVAIATGDAHSCAVRSGGTVACWGAGDHGRLGDGSDDDRPTPVGVVGITNARAVAAGEEHSCAVLETGAVRCWGAGEDGQLGNGGDDDATSPVNVSGLGDAVAITAGEAHSCALRSGGTVRCWGDNWDGQLGDGTNVDRLVPTAVGDLTGIVALTAGRAFTCAVATDGEVHCWGANGGGQLGDGSSAPTAMTPVVVPGAIGAIGVAAAGDHACSLDASAAVRCWGFGTDGRLGNGRSARTADPVPVVGLDGVTAISVGRRSSCALRQTGMIRCWGDGRDGRLGTGTYAVAAAPVDVTGVSDATSLVAGGHHHCAVHGTGSAADRAIDCWGVNDSGQLGNGTTLDTPLPTAVHVALPLGGDPQRRFAAMTAGDAFTCALVTETGQTHGAVWCWGRGDYGQLGHGSFVAHPVPPVTTPVAVLGLEATATQGAGPTVASGDNHSCAVSASPVPGSVWCWGSHYYGQLGIGGPTGSHANNQAAPQLINALSGVASLAAGDNHTCARRTNGTVACWGHGTRGQLGNGPMTTSSVPVDVPGLTDVTRLDAGGDQTCATFADGATSCWGTRLDRATPGAQATPSPSAAASGASGLALTSEHACRLSGGTVRCWGSGRDGQLGDGPMPTGHHPIQRTPTLVVGFDPVDTPVDPTPPANPAPPADPTPPADPVPPVDPAPPVDPSPPLDPQLPVVPRIDPPRRPAAPTVELRDGRLALRALTLTRAKRAGTCPKTARATLTARVGRRTVRMTRTLRLPSSKAACRTTATVRLSGSFAKAKRVTLTIIGTGLTPSRRTLTPRVTTVLQSTAVKLDRLVVRSSAGDACPARATVTVTGATKATKRHAVRKTAPVRLAPTAHCHVTTTVTLPRALRRAPQVSVVVRGSGLVTTTRRVRGG